MDKCLSREACNFAEERTHSYVYSYSHLASNLSSQSDYPLPIKKCNQRPLHTSRQGANTWFCVLDKIYTSLRDWYEVPAVLPNIRRSDHGAVVMTPKQRSTDRGEDVTVVVRSQDANGRALLSGAEGDRLDAALPHGHVRRNDGGVLQHRYRSARLPPAAADSQTPHDGQAVGD